MLSDSHRTLNMTEFCLFYANITVTFVSLSNFIFIYTVNRKKLAKMFSDVQFTKPDQL